MRHISTDLVWGMDSKKEFIDHIKPIETNTLPAVRVEQADIYSVCIHQKEKFDLVLMMFNTLGIMYDIPLALRKLFDAVSPEGTLYLSFWKDDEITVKERCRIYTRTENKQAKIEPNPDKNLSDIVIYRNETEILRTAIFTKKFLQELVTENIPEADVEFVDLNAARIMLLHKGSLCLS